MIPKICRFIVVAALSIGFVDILHAGGWVVITTQGLRDDIVAGQPISLAYAVRQHGVHLVSGLAGQIEARSGAKQVRIAAAPAETSGYYSATLTVPRAGNWTIAIDSGFGGNFDTLSFTVQARSPGSAAASLTELERGHRLFAAKGCVMCHTHTNFDQPNVKVGPALGVRSYEPDYVRQVLSRSESAEGGQWKMPNLGLRDGEISSLVAFLTSRRAEVPIGFPPVLP